jgi:hypothetical protein
MLHRLASCGKSWQNFTARQIFGKKVTRAALRSQLPRTPRLRLHVKANFGVKVGKYTTAVLNRAKVVDYLHRHGFRRNCLAGDQPAILLLQAKVRTLWKIKIAR